MNVECERWHKQATGALIGFADLRIADWGMRIAGCPVFSKDGRKWVQFPAHKVTKDGKPVFRHGKPLWADPDIKLDPEVMKAFGSAAMDAINAFLSDEGVPPWEDAA